MKKDCNIQGDSGEGGNLSVWKSGACFRKEETFGQSGSSVKSRISICREKGVGSKELKEVLRWEKWGKEKIEASSGEPWTVLWRGYMHSVILLL